MNVRPALYAAFAVSGVAGLAYEVVWSRYLALFVGHGAHAQVLVLAVYLGGMAAGALAISDRSRGLARPLVAYAVLETALAVFGFTFPTLFTVATSWSYDALFPGLGSAPLVGAARWALAGALILPQSMLLGATFPLMAAALTRMDAERPGGAVARAYLLNTAGGAAGVLITGFALIGWLGLPGTSRAAALLNLVAAALAFMAARSTGGAPAADLTPPVAPRTGTPSHGAAEPPVTAWTPELGVARTPDRRGHTAIRRLGLILLPAAFGSAVASFAYEIGWMRMLSLLLGSATHSFELMLSAFILGLALGAYLVADASDRAPEPMRLLGLVQVAMGCAALLSLPVYVALFDVIGGMVTTLPGRPGGYLLFNLGRYGLALLVMLPATVLAGAALPLLTAVLLRAGAGEASIGRVYAANTLGSVVGVGAAGLVLLPALGLKGLLMAGAALDAAIGLALLAAAGTGIARWRAPAGVGAALVLVFGIVTWSVRPDEIVLTSGVFRHGSLPDATERRVLYYRDGRTATVSAYLDLVDGTTVLATNGKPDASLGAMWRLEGRDSLPEMPVPPGEDAPTQLLGPLIGLAHRPDAVRAANLGHGSGLSAAALLTSPRLERVVTIEIEPLMVEGSLVFLPSNEAAFSDPRHGFVFDDARSFFSYGGERFDVVFSEPSNPWVAGTAGLFTREFYRRVAAVLSEEGVLAQWIQLYELDDDLFASMLAALDASFSDYRAYLVGDSDVVIVATNANELGEPDWSVLGSEGARALTRGMPEILPQHMEALRMFDRSLVRPLLARGEVPINSDYHPVVDLRAERARFEGAAAVGAYSFAGNPMDLTLLVDPRRVSPKPYRTPPAHGLAPVLRVERGAWLRAAVSEGGGTAPEPFPDWSDALVHLQTFLLITSADRQLGSWLTWGTGFSKAATDLHWGTSGWADAAFYGAVDRFLDRAEAPREARAAVAFHKGWSLLDWEMVASAADVLVPRVAAGETWLPAGVLLDGAVVAYLRVGRAQAARNTLARLVPRTTRGPGDFRIRVLDALVTEAGSS